LGLHISLSCLVFPLSVVVTGCQIRLRNGNNNRNLYKYVRIITNQPDTKSNPTPNTSPKPSTNQHAVVNIQLNMVTRLAYPEKFIRDNGVATFLQLSAVIVSRPSGVT